MSKIEIAKDVKFLIVEDDKSNLDHLSRTLLYNTGVPSGNVSEAETADEAIEIISDFEPDIVLLDLKLPRKKGDEPSIDSAVEILKEIELHNYRNNRFVRVIVISGSVQDAGVQQLILGDRSNIVKFLDKNAIAIDSDEFKTKLFIQINKATNGEDQERIVEYTDIRNSQARKLKKLHPTLWKKIEDDILEEFEKLFEKHANIPPRAQQIVGACGKVVEDIIALLADDSLDLSAQKYSDDPNSVRRKLQGLTGRRWIGREDGFENTGSDVLITRAAAEYGAEAYLHRSHALHGNEGDDKNERLYPQNYKFTIEDAAISINLIMPLINDYIKHLESKLKKK
jgi:CheY-like chemotaxis protein